MGTQFTDARLRAEKPAEKDKWLTEGGRRGEGKLLFRVSPDGTKRFYYRMPAGCGTRSPVPLATYDQAGKRGYSLAQARAKVAELESLRRKHGNPINFLKIESERKVGEARQAEMDRAKEGSFGELLATYVEKLNREGKTSARDVENCFRLHIREATPDLIEQKAVEITPVDVHRILAKMVGGGRTRQVNKLRSYLLAAFNYAATAAYDPRRAQGSAAFGLQSNPVAITKRVQEFERAGERVLSADELTAYIRHLDQVPNVAVRRFLLAALFLGGQRIRQLLRLRKRDIDFNAGIIKLQDSKGRNGVPRDHLLPLTARVCAILENDSAVTSPDDDERERWIFSSAGRVPLYDSTVSRAVADYSCWLVDHANIEPFSARDLRRTCETRLAELNVSKDARAQLLSHGISGVQAKHYDRHSYLPQKRVTLERWEEYLDGLLESVQNTVELNATRTQCKEP